jgi:hypothetical protein
MMALPNSMQRAAPRAAADAERTEAEENEPNA